MILVDALLFKDPDPQPWFLDNLSGPLEPALEAWNLRRTEKESRKLRSDQR